MAGKAKTGFTNTETMAIALPENRYQRLKDPFPEHETKLGEVWSNGFQGTIVEWNYVCDRIEEVDPNWEHHVEVKYHGPIGNKMVVEATVRLNILGLTRMGHSSAAGTSDNIGQVAKSVETDALKRAATKFGVARYLYRGDQRQEARSVVTEAQLEAIHRAAGDAGVKVGASISEWASGLLGRTVDVVAEPITAHELDILLAAGGK